MCPESDTGVRGDLGNRILALLLVFCFLTAFGWSGQASSRPNPARVGVLSLSAVTDDSRLWPFMNAFRQTLADRGWMEGKNIVFEYRSAHGDPSRFSEAAVELVGLDVDVILASSAPALHAAQMATRTVPIVASDYTTNPVAVGYVENYSRPGGNVTGVFLDAPEFAGKWFELLQAIIPDLSRVAVLWDPSPGTTHLEAVRRVGGMLNIELQVLQVRKPDDIDKAFSAISGQSQAVIFLPSPMLHGANAQLASLTLKRRLPGISMASLFATAGGTLSYGPDLTETWRRCGMFVAKILGGSNPAELPVERPSSIQLVVNMRSATAFGITIPQSILLRADEVIR